MRTPQQNLRASFSMIKLVTLTILLLATAWAPPGIRAEENGILKKQSKYSVPETVERFETAVRARGMKFFPRFDHAAAAEEYGQTLPPLVVISFGNPGYGTQLMARVPTAGIDFPPKALVYQDDQGKVWLAYNSSRYLFEVIFKRHGLDYSEGGIKSYAKVLDELTDQAVK